MRSSDAATSVEVVVWLRLRYSSFSLRHREKETLPVNRFALIMFLTA